MVGIPDDMIMQRYQRRLEQAHAAYAAAAQQQQQQQEEYSDDEPDAKKTKLDPFLYFFIQHANRSLVPQTSKYHHHKLPFPLPPRQQYLQQLIPQHMYHWSQMMMNPRHNWYTTMMKCQWYDNIIVFNVSNRKKNEHSFHNITMPCNKKWYVSNNTIEGMCVLCISLQFVLL